MIILFFLYLNISIYLLIDKSTIKKISKKILRAMLLPLLLFLLVLDTIWGTISLEAYTFVEL